MLVTYDTIVPKLDRPVLSWPLGLRALPEVRCGLTGRDEDRHTQTDPPRRPPRKRPYRPPWSTWHADSCYTSEVAQIVFEMCFKFSKRVAFFLTLLRHTI